MIENMVDGLDWLNSAKKELENILYDMEEQLENWADENGLLTAIESYPDLKNKFLKNMEDVKYTAFLDAKNVYEDYIDSGKTGQTSITSTVSSITTKALKEFLNIKNDFDKEIASCEEVNAACEYILAYSPPADDEVSDVQDISGNSAEELIVEADNGIFVSEETNKDLSEIMNNVENSSSELVTLNADVDITKLSVDDLTKRFISIGQQAQLQQGLILLELRSRFPSKKEFGKFIANSTFCANNHQQHTKLMNLARFFGNRDMKGISLSVAYEISAPKNAEVAEEIYNLAYGKFFSVGQVTAEIEKLIKKENPTSELMESEDILSISESENSELENESAIVPDEKSLDIDALKEQLLLIVAPVPIDVVEALFKDCVSKLKANVK